MPGTFALFLQHPLAPKKKDGGLQQLGVIGRPVTGTETHIQIDTGLSFTVGYEIIGRNIGGVWFLESESSPYLWRSSRPAGLHQSIEANLQLVTHAEMCLNKYKTDHECKMFLIKEWRDYFARTR